MVTPYIVAISGPTNAGKTFLREMIMKRGKAKNILCNFMTTDDFYRDLTHLTMDERNAVNYDAPDSIDEQEFFRTLDKLKQGKSVDIPIYDFSVHNRSDETRTIDPLSLLLIEGIFSFSFHEVFQFYDLKLYVELDPDLRFIRRLSRDVKERGRSVESIVHQYLTTVRPSQQQFVMLDRVHADIILAGHKDYKAFVDLLLNAVENLHQA